MFYCFTEKGWEIERETYTEEFLQKLTDLFTGGDFSLVTELKDWQVIQQVINDLMQ